MHLRLTARVVVFFCAIAWLLCCAPIAQAAVVIDDFALPNPMDWIQNVTDPNPPSRFFRQETDPVIPSPSILGGERDMWIETLGTPTPMSVLATFGTDGSGRSTLMLGTAGSAGSRLVLQYDGLDPTPGVPLAPDPMQLRPPVYNPVQAEVNNARDLDASPAAGFDLTQGGANDALELRFASTDGVDPQGLEVGIVATSPTGGSLSWWGYVPNSTAPVTATIGFTEFTQHGSASFGNIDSLLFFFNPYGIPNVDFALDSIAAVPEPSTLALLGLAIVVFAAYGVRRRKR